MNANYPYFSSNFNRHGKILLFLVTLCNAGALNAAQSDSERFYSIRPDGIGLLSGANVTFADAKALYPYAAISVELGHPAMRWRKKFIGSSKQYFFVFRQNNRELFRAECSCTPNGESDWIHRYLRSPEEKIQMIINPIATNSRFHTERGIRVGSSISDLRRAYPELHKLTAVMQTVSTTPEQQVEFVCFDNGIVNAGEDSIHSMNFYVRPARGKVLVGKYSNKEYTTSIDPRATIVGIQPHSGCLLNNVSSD